MAKRRPALGVYRGTAATTRERWLAPTFTLFWLKSLKAISSVKSLFYGNGNDAKNKINHQLSLVFVDRSIPSGGSSCPSGPSIFTLAPGCAGIRYGRVFRRFLRRRHGPFFQPCRVG